MPDCVAWTAPSGKLPMATEVKAEQGRLDDRGRAPSAAGAGEADSGIGARRKRAEPRRRQAFHRRKAPGMSIAPDHRPCSGETCERPPDNLG
jgi:hypothetical protein